MTDEPLDLTDIEARDGKAIARMRPAVVPEDWYSTPSSKSFHLYRDWAWFHAEHDRRALLAEVKRLRAEVDRLRQQNKASADEWARRVADLQSYHDRWENVRRYAHDLLVTRADGGRWLGYSQIQEAQVAAALTDPERAERLLAAFTTNPSSEDTP